MRSLSDAPENEFSKIKYVLTDIDDTLTYRGKLSARAYAALERLQTAGFKVIPVTAAPAGWCDLMVRMWPIDAVIGENGGFYSVRHADHIERIFWLSDADRADARQRLLGLVEQIENAVPSAKLAADQAFRLTSIAWERPGAPATTARILESLLKSGANATVNSIWVLGWCGNYDKLAMARRMMSEVYSVSIDSARDEVVYVGDSANDGPMFNHFPNSIGVSTVVEFMSQLTKPPTWVTHGHGGDGFVEVADAVIAGVRRVRELS
jgi:HAD superfamily hydrolase (TIGR01484 family)